MIYVYSIITIAFSIYLFLWSTVIFKYRKEAENYFEHIVRTYFPIPFWILLVWFSLGFYFPEIPQYFYPAKKFQYVQIKNDTKTDKNFIILSSKYSIREWQSQYEFMKIKFTPIITIEPTQKKLLKFVADSGTIKRIYIETLDYTQNLPDTMSNAKAFYVPQQKMFFFASEFKNSKVLKVYPTLEYEIFMLFMNLTCAIGITWHLFKLQRNKKSINSYIFGSIILAASLYNVFMFSRTIFVIVMRMI